MGSIQIGLGYLAAGIGAGLAVVGGGIGIGLLVASALEGIARQPEMFSDLRTTMFVGAALVEGLALFAMVLMIIMIVK